MNSIRSLPTTGNLPTAAYLCSQNNLSNDLRLADIEFCFSGGLDAPSLIPAGGMHGDDVLPSGRCGTLWSHREY